MFHANKPAATLKNRPRGTQIPQQPIDANVQQGTQEESIDRPAEPKLPSTVRPRPENPIPSPLQETANTSIVIDPHIQKVRWQYNAGRDINITNVQSWDGLAEQMDKIHAEIAKASDADIINTERAEAIQTQLSAIGAEMRRQDRDREVIMRELRSTQSHVGAASMELAQKVAECTLEIERLQQRYGRFAPAQPDVESQLITRSTLLTGMAGLVALALDLGLTGGVVTALPALMVLGQSALALFKNTQEITSCPVCGNQIQAG